MTNIKQIIKDFTLKINTFNFSSIEINSLFSLLYLLSLVILFTPFGEFFLSESFPRKMNLNTGDSGSYINYSFESLEIILSQHRSFGLPLILKLYTFFDEKLIYWPFITFLFYIISNNFMLNTLITNNFSKVFSCIFCFLVFMSYNVWEYTFGWTEIWGISFFILSISLMIISINKKNIFILLLFSITLFYTIQIRPSFIFIVFFPIIFSIYFYLNKNYIIFAKLILASLTPLIFFIILKFSLTGSVGITSFTGVQLSGHAGFYLNEKTLSKIKDNENREIALNFYEKKKNFSKPCDINSLNKKNKNSIHKYCWNIYLMQLWLDIVKQEINITPFNEDDKKNFEAWKYTNLDHFFGKIKNNVLIDKKLSNFSAEIIKINFKEHIIWSLNSMIFTLKTVFLHPAIKNLLLISSIILIYYYFFRKKDIQNNILRDKSYENVLFISILMFSLISLIIFGLLHIPHQRTAGVQFIFLIPSIVGFITHLMFRNKT